MSPSRVRLLCLLALAPAACNGGPISDFPHGSTGEDTGGDADGPGDGASQDGSGDGALGDGTAGGDPDSPPGAADGGVSAPGDGGLPDAGDGGAAACSFASEATGDGCYGIYCGTTLAELGAATASGACSADLSLVCGGDLTKAVATCSASHARDADFAGSVTACARAASTLTTATDGCLGCYVAEAQCALDQCLEACLGGLPGACDGCRLERCGPAFATCSGLPSP